MIENKLKKTEKKEGNCVNEKKWLFLFIVWPTYNLTFGLQLKDITISLDFKTENVLFLRGLKECVDVSSKTV